MSGTSRRRSPPPDDALALRALVLDQQLDRGIVWTLKRRGLRDATHVSDRGLLGYKDPPLISRLFEASPPVVLVTFDNDMPWDHQELLRRLPLPLAVIDSRADRGAITLLEYHFDVVARWAHAMTTLTPGDVVFFSRVGKGLHRIDSLPGRNSRSRGRRPSAQAVMSAAPPAATQPPVRTPSPSDQLLLMPGSPADLGRRRRRRAGVNG